MNEVRPGIDIVKDLGYKVIMKNEDGSPRLVWRGFVKDGQYGKFVSIEKHWVKRMEGKKITDSEFERKRFTFPYDKAKAFAMFNSVKELLVSAFETRPELEEEMVEKYSDELGWLDDES